MGITEAVQLAKRQREFARHLRLLAINGGELGMLEVLNNRENVVLASATFDVAGSFCTDMPASSFNNEATSPSIILCMSAATPARRLDSWSRRRVAGVTAS